MPRIIVCGPVFLDVVMSGLDGPPRLGEEQWVSGSQLTVGGAANQAVALTRLGIDASICSHIGTDLPGQIVVDVLAGYGVDTTLCERGADQAMTVALSWSGDRALVSHGELRTATLPDSTPAPDVLMGDLPSLAANDDLVSRWRATGTTVIGDIGWDATGKWDIADLAPLRLCDYFVPNEDEVRNYARVDDVFEAAENLQARLNPNCSFVVTRGPKGVIAHADQWFEFPALDVEFVDATGAGDAFGAGLATGVALGANLRQSVSLASTVSGLSVTRTGGAGSTPTSADILALDIPLPAEYDLSFYDGEPTQGV